MDIWGTVAGKQYIEEENAGIRPTLSGHPLGFVQSTAEDAELITALSVRHLFVDILDTLVNPRPQSLLNSEELQDGALLAHIGNITGKPPLLRSSAKKPGQVSS